MAILRLKCGMVIFTSLLNQRALWNMILLDMSRLLQKTRIEDAMPVTPAQVNTSDHFLKTILINLKTINARYEKGEARNQVQWLMETDNIQIDELMERIRS